MPAKRSKIKVGLAQIDARLGDLAFNLAHHLEWIDQARAEGVELLLFPELSLTGYRLLHLTPRVAIHPASSPIDIVLAGSVTSTTLYEVASSNSGSARQTAASVSMCQTWVLSV